MGGVWGEMRNTALENEREVVKLATICKKEEAKKMERIRVRSSEMDVGGRRENNPVRRIY